MRTKWEENMMIKAQDISSKHYWWNLKHYIDITYVISSLSEIQISKFIISNKYHAETKFRNCLKSNTLLGVCISGITDMLLYDMHHQHVSFKTRNILTSIHLRLFSLSLSPFISSFHSFSFSFLIFLFLSFISKRVWFQHEYIRVFVCVLSFNLCTASSECVQKR